jgi:hypothetical protein
MVTQEKEVKMSKNIKYLFISLILLFGGLGCFITDRLGSAVGGVATTDQAEAAKRAQAVVNYTLPEGFTEQMAMGMLGVEFVFMADAPLDADDNEAKNFILLAKLPENAGNAAADLKKQAEDALSSQRGDNNKVDMKQVDSREITINGEPTTLNVEEGQAEDGEGFRMMTAAFKAKDDGPALLLIFGPTASWNDPAIDQFLSSMQ